MNRTQTLLPLIILLLMARTSVAEPPTAEPLVGFGTKELPIPGESFLLKEREAFFILPPDAGKRIPWVWYAPTLPGLPAKSEVWMFERFLADGVAIAGIDVGESYGSPEATKLYQAFYEHLVGERGFGTKPCLLARSRGGLMLYNWAIAHPNSVSGVAGIYPVCNIASYPGVDRAAGAYQLSADQLQQDLMKHNPVDRIEKLAKAEVPIFHIHGDSDKVVPLESNSALLAERYRSFGGPAKIEVVKGQGHNMWDGWFQSQRLTDFVIERALLGRRGSR